MLQVLDNGVKIQLAPTSAPSNNFSIILIAMGLLVLVGVAVAIGLPIEIAVVLAIVIIAGGFFWQKIQAPAKHTQTKLISGGEVIITPAQIEHLAPSGQTQVYPLPQSIRFTQSDHQLLITNTSAQPLLTIQGFSQPQHASIAQAVLEGKQIKTQGKTIRMQAP